MVNISLTLLKKNGDGTTQTTPKGNLAIKSTDITTSSNLISTDIIRYNSRDIKISNYLVCITDIWKAEGRPIYRNPGNWIKHDSARENISRLCCEFGLPESDLVISKSGGKKGYTYAHYEIARFYCWYLSIKAHTWFMDDLIRFYNQMKNEGSYQQGIDCINARLDRIDRILSGDIEARGLTAGQIWKKYNLPAISGSAIWLANQLIRRECHVEGMLKSTIGDVSVNLYDPVKTDYEMNNNGLYVTCLKYIMKKQNRDK